MTDQVSLVGGPSEITEVDDAWIVTLPRICDARGSHRHTYGLLTPYFKGLTDGKLLATRCVNLECPVSKGNGEMWLPPRADCPDCHHRMKWVEIEDPVGYIYAYTLVERGGFGLEIETPYWQVDVRLPGVCTLLKGYLVDRVPEISIGDEVEARFRTGDKATNTCLDICWTLIPPEE